MLLDFCDHTGKKIAIPYHRIYDVRSNDGRSDERGIKTVINYDGGGNSRSNIYLKESFEEVTDYIKMGKWEKIK